MEQGQDIQAPGIEAVPSVDETITEKMVPQSAVDKAVQHAKHLAREQGRREALSTIQAQQAPTVDNQMPQAQAPAQSIGGMPSVSPEQVQKMIAEHAQQQAQQYHAHSIANEFLSKLEAGKEKYPDFNEKMDSLELSTIPQVVQLANSVDNTADVMYELANNPNKLVTLLNLTNFGNGKLAYLETRKLSDSIKQNQTALQQPIPPEPLSPLKPSNVGTDNGALSIKELRRQQHLRV